MAANKKNILKAKSKAKSKAKHSFIKISPASKKKTPFPLPSPLPPARVIETCPRVIETSTEIPPAVIETPPIVFKTPPRVIESATVNNDPVFFSCTAEGCKKAFQAPTAQLVRKALMRHLFRYQKRGVEVDAEAQDSDLMTAKQIFDRAHYLAYKAEILFHSNLPLLSNCTKHY